RTLTTVLPSAAKFYLAFGITAAGLVSGKRSPVDFVNSIKKRLSSDLLFAGGYAGLNLAAMEYLPSSVDVGMTTPEDVNLSA
ncbi:hypothetical protein, partial [Pseudomonas sp. SIMBA_067]